MEKMIRRLFFMILALLLVSATGRAQHTVTGTVYDEGKQAMTGVNVIVKGTLTGVVTDLDGRFSVSIPQGGVLVFTFIGYEKQEVPVGERTRLEIFMQEEKHELDEIVVIGYGTLKKSDVTGTVASVKPEVLESRATINPAEALQGLVSGVNVQKYGGTAGSGVYVKIRGVNTFGSNEPLYIIDGFQGSINTVNPADIESMEVLKDGAAAAIYGSVAANGVIIVTTKSGKKDEVKVDFNSYVSITQTANRLELLDAGGYVEVHKRMYENYNAYSSNPATLPAYISNPGPYNTDWQDAVFRNGLSQNYSLGIQGGQGDVRFALYGNYAQEKGVVIDNSFGQKNASAKVSFRKAVFDVDAKLAYSGTSNAAPNFQLKEAYMISPLVPVYDSSEPYGYGLTNKNGLPNNVNPVAEEHYKTSLTKGQDVTGNIAVTANIVKGLKFKTAYSYRATNQQYTYHYPRYIADPKVTHDYPYNEEKRTFWNEQIWDNILTYNNTFGAHSVNVMAGMTINPTSSNWNTVGVEGKTTDYSVDNGKLIATEKPAGFLDENFETIDAGKGGTYSASGSKFEYNRASFFGRINYGYKDKYLLQATIRYDGSSKFGSESRWGVFPSVALGWRIEQEDFFPDNTFISNLKLRASWGQLGNEIVLGYYDSQALITTRNGLYLGYVQGTGNNPWPGSIATSLENRSLQWETTDSKNIGLDYGLWRGKVNGSMNYFFNTTNNLLITKKLAPSAGLDDPVLNVGKVRNSGFEFEINYRESIDRFQFNVGFNLSTLKNKVISLADEDQALYGEGLKFDTEHFPTQTRVGKPMGAFYLYRTDGIFQSDREAADYTRDGKMIQPNAKAGDIRFKDLNGDGVIDEDDKEYAGSGLPKVEANISLGAAYMGFDFSALIGSGWGNKLYNGNRYFYEAMSSGTNMLATTLNSWTPQNTSTDIPRAVLQDDNGNSRESDRFLESGNFIRIRQLQLGYSLPKELLGSAKIDKLRIYISCENIYTWTKYSGIDPEFARSSVLNTGIDRFVFPFTKSFVAGLQFVF